MIKSFEWKIALRYLITKRKEGFISVINTLSLIGIALGVSVLIIVMSVMRGYEVELMKRILGINGHFLITYGNYKSLPHNDQLNAYIKGVNGVKFAASTVTEQAMIMGKNATGVMVRGMNGMDLRKKPVMQNAIIEGGFNEYDAGRGILIGTALAKHLNVNIGDEIKLISPELDNLAIGSIPKAKTFKIAGIFDVGMYEYNSSTIFMPIKLAQIFFGMQGKVSSVEIVAQDNVDLTTLQNDLYNVLSKKDPNLVIVDWTTQNESLINALRIERNVMFFILSLIIMIAAFNIITSLTMLVNDKKTSIAIFKTIGMSKFSIVKIFVICGSMIGILGAILGCVFGILFSANIEKIRSFLESMIGIPLFDPVIYFLTSLPSEISIDNVLIVLSMAIFLSIISTIYPALKAAKMSPVYILRSR